MRRAPVFCFLAAAVVPLLATFGLFVYLQWPSATTEPRQYMELLGRRGRLNWSISAIPWKYFLARDPLCARARTVIFGSSRDREVNGLVLGHDGPACNLHVNGLDAPTLAFLADVLPALAPDDARTVYVGLDHFFFWWKNNVPDEMRLAEGLPAWGKVWRLGEMLNDFSLIRLRSVWSRRFGEEQVLWFPQGHLFHLDYYVRKMSGAPRTISGNENREAVSAHFGRGGGGMAFEPGYARTFQETLRNLRAKGYKVRIFWNPLVPSYLAEARRRHPGVFQEAIDTVERIVAAVGVDAYPGAGEKLDASHFGCTERDYIDAAHVDVDCLNRFAAAVFGPRPANEALPLSQVLLNAYSRR